MSQTYDPVPSARGAESNLQSVGPPAVGTRDHERNVVELLGQDAEGLHQGRVVLARLDGPEREHVTPGTVGPAVGVSRTGVIDVVMSSSAVNRDP